MSLSAINSITSALNQLEQQKTTAAQNAEKDLVAKPQGPATTPATGQLPQDTVTLSSTDHQSKGADVYGSVASH